MHFKIAKSIKEILPWYHLILMYNFRSSGAL